MGDVTIKDIAIIIYYNETYHRSDNMEIIIRNSIRFTNEYWETENKDSLKNIKDLIKFDTLDQHIQEEHMLRAEEYMLLNL
jgi:hypothetical protein